MNNEREISNDESTRTTDKDARISLSQRVNETMLDLNSAKTSTSTMNKAEVHSGVLPAMEIDHSSGTEKLHFPNEVHTQRYYFEDKDGLGNTVGRDLLTGQRTFNNHGEGKITLNSDGSFKVDGKIKNTETTKDGQTTVTFQDGSTVTFDKTGFTGATNGNSGYTKEVPESRPKECPNTPARSFPELTPGQPEPAKDPYWEWARKFMEDHPGTFFGG